jgi:pimeloyl-ACP methyl ester carboxylesterase
MVDQVFFVVLKSPKCVIQHVLAARYEVRGEHLAFINTNERAIETAFRGFHEDDIHADFPHVKSETLLIVAGAGGVIQPEDVAEIKQLLPSIKVEHVTTAGHMIPYEDYDGFFAVLAPFLENQF